jgi:hypothetical protein
VGNFVLPLFNLLTSGNHWAVESEIFWKARGDHGWCAEAVIACVFKKLYEATARWYDAGERVERNGCTPINYHFDSTLSAIYHG